MSYVSPVISTLAELKDVRYNIDDAVLEGEGLNMVTSFQEKNNEAVLHLLVNREENIVAICIEEVNLHEDTSWYNVVPQNKCVLYEERPFTTIYDKVLARWLMDILERMQMERKWIFIYETTFSVALHHLANKYAISFRECLKEASWVLPDCVYKKEISTLESYMSTPSFETRSPRAIEKLLDEKAPCLKSAFSEFKGGHFEKYQFDFIEDLDYFAVHLADAELI